MLRTHRVAIGTYVWCCCVMNALTAGFIPNGTQSTEMMDAYRDDAVMWTRSGARTTASTEASPFDRCSPADKCRNGVESGLCPRNDSCDCSLDGIGAHYYWGTTCDKLNLTLTSRLVTRRSLVITWQLDPNLKGKYYFVFRKTSSPDRDVRIESVNQINNRSVRLINVDDRSADYVICLMNQELAAVVYTTKNVSRLDVKYSDCVTMNCRSSTVWSQQLAFYLVCAGMGLVLLVIFFVGCVKESLDKRNYHLFDTGLEHEEHEVDDVRDTSSDKEDIDNTCAIDESNDADIAMETV